ncbi:MAG: ABC transporter ATP-binding protein NatA [candidate division WS2 bacterium]|nr:ABC transporter ATP-binding protein NatA [Candidatus Lithacetigena glycinireducens]
MVETIVCRNVSKVFRAGKQSVEALLGINLTITRGMFVVIGGENGSGKSTLLKLLVGLLLPDQGEITVLGVPVKTGWKRLATRIGVVLPSDRSLYWKLTAKENLHFHGGIYGLKRNEIQKRTLELLLRLGLLSQQDQLVEGYSTGMRRKLMLAKALLHKPEILFADEVLSGLDPRTTTEVLAILEEFNREGMTVVMVSHVLHNLPAKARFLLLKNGKIVLDGPLNKFQFEGVVRIRAMLGDREIEEIAEEAELSEVILQLIQQGASEVRIEKDDLYSLVRRYLA